jgi:hypothetical protein
VAICRGDSALEAILPEKPPIYRTYRFVRWSGSLRIADARGVAARDQAIPPLPIYAIGTCAPNAADLALNGWLAADHKLSVALRRRS